MPRWGRELHARSVPFRSSVTAFYISYRIKKLQKSLYGRDHLAISTTPGVPFVPC